MTTDEVKCKNPKCHKIFTGSHSKLFCSRKCAGEVYASKKGVEEYFDFEGERLTKSQLSKRTGVPVFLINQRVKYLGLSVVEAARVDLLIRCRWCEKEFCPGPKCKAGFCSVSCSNNYCNKAAEFQYKDRVCVGCGASYTPRSRAQDYCTRNCRQVNYNRKNLTTDDQYARINGDWRRYFQRLVSQKGRSGLTAEMLVEIGISQGWRCALSGLEMQCYLRKGYKNPYNASIDRIQPGGAYSRENIRLTCAAVNKWRGELETDCFIKFCRAIADYNPRKEHA